MKEEQNCMAQEEKNTGSGEEENYKLVAETT
jgi:hypothetical protein